MVVDDPQNLGEAEGGAQAPQGRLLVGEFLARFVKQAEALPVGNPLDPATRVGPLVSVEHLDKVMSYVELGGRGGCPRRRGS